MLRIGIDYGHGLHEPAGAKRYTFTDESPPKLVVEGEINRRVASRVLRALVREPGVAVFDLVAKRRTHSDDTTPEDTPLAQRVEYANTRALDLVFSIHTNAIGNAIEGPSLPARGFRAFVFEGTTSPVALAVAEHVTGCVEALTAGRVALTGQDGLKARPVKGARFYMLRKTTAPAVLVEGGFFTNRADVALLEDPVYRAQLAAVYVRAILAVLRF
jgi:N-acetylmuramoyl-L-alanine amidase